MKRIRLTYHTLHVLSAADPKLRKAIIANCKEENFKSICDCALNVLRINSSMSACSKRKLRPYKNSLRKVADKSVSLSPKRKFTSHRSRFLLQLQSAILSTLAGLLFRSC